MAQTRTCCCAWRRGGASGRPHSQPPFSHCSRLVGVAFPNSAHPTNSWQAFRQEQQRMSHAALQVMDQLQQVVKPLQEFAKDSMRLVKRCTKPDMKGKNERERESGCEIVPLCRVPANCSGNSHWICGDGVHRILCQAHSHPHQQHHCVSWLTLCVCV